MVGAFGSRCMLRSAWCFAVNRSDAESRDSSTIDSLRGIPTLSGVESPKARSTVAPQNLASLFAMPVLAFAS